MSCISADERFRQIEAKYQSLLEEGIDYGGRLSQYVEDWLNSDVYESHHGFVEYTVGRICWGNDTGVHGVHRDFQEAWKEYFYSIGYPVTTTRPSRQGRGRFTRFQDGWLVSGSGEWSRMYKYVPNDLPTVWAFNNDQWKVILLTQDGWERPMMRDDIDIQPPSTDYSKHIAVLLRGTVMGGDSIRMPINLYASGSVLVFDIQGLELGDGCFAPANVTNPYWSVDIPRTCFDGGVPSEVRLSIQWKKGPPCSPQFE